ncbi:MAG: cation:proton antiporter, partial [Candidatus Aminicenantes bacterium]|nr:cation:proton antiporter [Candidatus Aminicenantes bacterium]
SLGTEMILGAFLAGAVLSLLGVSGDEDTRPGLEAIGFGFFIPLFFITVGIRFDFGALARNPAAALLVPGLLAAALAVKILPALFLRLSFTWRETFGAGILLSARLSLIIAASGIGLRLGLIDPAANAAVIVVAAVTSTLAPIGFGFLAPRAPGRKQSPIILFGTGDLSLQVARELAGRGETPVMLGPLAEAWAKDVDPRSWAARFDPRHVRSFMALSPSDDENLLAGREAVSAGVPHVIAAVNNPSRLPEYLAAGVRPVVHGVAQAALLALIAENPVFVGQLMAGHAAFQVQEHVLENPALAGRPLKDVALGPDLLLLSISREGEMLIPHGNTVLQAGDQLTLLGSGPALESIATRLSGTDR